MRNFAFLRISVTIKLRYQFVVHFSLFAVRLLVRLNKKYFFLV